ncbi:hypothetical protein BJ878DRAFT_536863 [Calycina marina]|uniref:NB-ARC domain-containing protein n=1 Tax=Calycina marina TaxID=1763456 RepID=A0A9P7YVQ5_9HELO|nr:hypothetical protein BJ878DRAFT_536863 [Calycina marina]
MASIVRSRKLSGKTPRSETGSSQSPEQDRKIWKVALQRYYDELTNGGYKSHAIDKDLWDVKDPEELLKQMKDLPSSGRSPEDLNILKKILLGLSDFAAVAAWALGMNGRVAAVIWGSIRLLFVLSQPAFPKVIQMLKDLEMTLPKYKNYEENLPMTPELEYALCDVYTDIILFCAQAITFFRNNPNFNRSPTIWSRFNGKFQETIKNLQRHSKLVDEQVDIIRLRREADSAETLNVIANMKAASLSDQENLPCHSLPYGLNPQFLERSEEVSQVRAALDPDPTEDGYELKVLAIHGLGGVGKSQVALHYANISMKLFDVIVWIPSETHVKMAQAIANFAVKLGIPRNDTNAKEGDIQMVTKVKEWLNSSSRTFLLIFDNAEDISVVLPVWPSSNRGSILVTTRSSSTASKRASNILHLNSFDPEAGKQALSTLTGLAAKTEVEVAALSNICRVLGGLPLAMVQISQFIRERGLNYEEFLRLYEKSASKIHARGETPQEYNHTLSTVWAMSLEKLSLESEHLLSLLAFFDPDQIFERLLTNARASLKDDCFDFLIDDFDFGDAVSALLKLSFIDRSSAQKSLSIHRLVQTTVLSGLPKDRANFFLTATIQLLSSGFPNTWGVTGHQQGHGWESWESCGEVLPHVQNLIEIVKRQELKPESAEKFAELIFRVGTYLWETEQPSTALYLFNFGLSLGLDSEGLICNHAVRIVALNAYQKTLEARLKLDPKRMARTLAIYAMTYLRAEMSGEALQALKSCWELQGMTEEQITQSRYPKHSGDIVLLARIYYLQDKKEEALQLASKTITIRKGILGIKGPRVADSMFIVAGMLREARKDALAMKLLRAIIDMAQGMIEMQGHLARALWTLGNMLEKMGDSGEGAGLKRAAKEVRGKIQGREAEDEDTDESFSKLVGYMLW